MEREEEKLDYLVNVAKLAIEIDTLNKKIRELSKQLDYSKEQAILKSPEIKDMQENFDSLVSERLKLQFGFEKLMTR